jgi:hypothetical protein
MPYAAFEWGQIRRRFTDIGYPKATMSNDGTAVLVYYFNDGEGLERYIAASRVRMS